MSDRATTLLHERRWRIVETSCDVGPRHDPYARDTLIVEDRVREKSWGFVSCGLAGYSIEIDDHVGAGCEFGEDRCAAIALFTKLTGYSPDQWRRFAAKAVAGKHCCKGGRHTYRNESGYPGESFLVCSKCGHTGMTSMDYEAIK